MRQTPIAILALAAVVTLGCGKSHEDRAAKPAEQPQIDACTLLPFDEAAALAGPGGVTQMSSALEDARGRDTLACAYNAGTAEQPRILSLVVRLHPDAQAAARSLATAEKALATMTRGDIQQVAGLGDGALWAGGSLQQLHVRRGTVQLLVTSQAGDAAAALETARRIAAKALERLP